MLPKYILILLLFQLPILDVMADSAPNSPTPDPIHIWVERKFIHSTLTREQQLDEMKWFASAAKPYQGLTIHVVSEDITTHRYESNVLAKAFSQITGIHVVHEITQEEDVVKKISAQMETGINIYDAYVNDTDFIGTHSRYGKTIPLSDMIQTDWSHITLPSLDLNDFIGLEFGKGMDGKLYQLPDQQFASLYWYRHDWFSRADLQQQFLNEYGYPLGVPQNWAAYEDIANFFTNSVRFIDNKRVWGHIDYSHYNPSLGWRLLDSWLSMAGANDKQPSDIQLYSKFEGVGDWGIRIKDCHPVGALMARGGALDSPAAVYAVEKYFSWLQEYAPSDIYGQPFLNLVNYLADGSVAQQAFWYTRFISLIRFSPNLLDKNGNPVWRVAPSPRGKYWQPGMKAGYQDVGGWTILRSTPKKRAEAAWLYAQFVVSKSVSMQKFLAGSTPIRLSDLESDFLKAHAEQWGGLLEFYLSNARNHWTPIGFSVPDYAELSSAWWQYMGPILNGEKNVVESMNALAEEMDRRLERLSQENELGCAPVLNPRRPTAKWLIEQGAPWSEIMTKPIPVTLPYNEAIKLWRRY